MMKLLLNIFSILAVANNKLLLWSPKKLSLPALTLYTTQHFQDIMRELGTPTLAIFKTNFSEIPISILREDLKLKSAYLPNADVDFMGFEVIEHNNDVSIIKEMCYIYSNLLLIFEEKSGRKKRFALASSTGDLYQDGNTMIYTKRHPLLKRGTTSYVLNKCIKASAHFRGTVLNFALTFEISNSKDVALEFSLVHLNDKNRTEDWKLENVKVSDQVGSVFLTSNIEIRIPELASYYCGLTIRFRDLDYDTVLLFYGIQIQPTGDKGRFSNAVECVAVMTPGIASVMFVIGIFLFGLFIGISALSSIKTMDKFDNVNMNKLLFEDIH